MGLIKQSKIKSYNTIHDKYRPYMFRHRSAICRKSTNIKSNTPLPVLIALALILKILKCYNYRTHKVDKRKSTLLQQKERMIVSVSLFQYKLAVVYIIFWNMYTYICHSVCVQRLRAGTGRGSLRYVFGVKTLWAYTCQLYVFQSFNFLII